MNKKAKKRVRAARAAAEDGMVPLSELPFSDDRRVRPMGGLGVKVRDREGGKWADLDEKLASKSFNDVVTSQHKDYEFAVTA